MTDISRREFERTIKVVMWVSLRIEDIPDMLQGLADYMRALDGEGAIKSIAFEDDDGFYTVRLELL